MQYVAIKPLPSAGKMLVTTEQTTIVQKQLIEQGNRWMFTDNRVDPACHPYIFWDSGDMTFEGESGKISYDEDTSQECIFTEYFEVEQEK